MSEPEKPPSAYAGDLILAAGAALATARQRSDRPLLAPDPDAPAVQVGKVDSPRAKTVEFLKNASPVPSLVLWGDPVLEQIAYRVTEFGEETRRILADLKARLAALPYGQKGYGLAAQQIGIQKAICYIRLPGVGTKPGTEIEMCNPIITRRARKYRVLEGCLSIPKFYHTIERYKQITVYFRDAAGQAVKLNATGLLAQCIQHEVEHMEGKLIITHVKERQGRRAAKRLMEKLHRA